MAGEDKDRSRAYSDDSDALEDLFRDRYKEGSAWCEKDHDRFREDFKMYAGHQHKDADIEYGEKRQYPILTINQVFSIVNAPSSSEIVNRFEPKYLPRLPEDQSLADKATQASRYIRQQAGAEFVDTDVYRDNLICGMAVSDWYFDETLGPEGKIMATSLPIEDFIWDPAARKRNLEDRRWTIRGICMDIDEFESLFPEGEMPASAKGKPAGMWGRHVGGVEDPDRYQDSESKAGFYFPSKRMVMVFEMQDYVIEPRYKLEGGDTVSHAEFSKLKEIAKEAGMPPPFGAERKARRYRRSFFAGDKLVRTEDLPGNMFSTSFLTCFDDKTSDGVRWFGLVRPLRDPQKIANRGYSQMVHIMSVSAKGTILAEEGVFENEQKAQIEWAKPGGWVTVRPGTLRDKRIEIIKSQYPDDFERITQMSLNIVPRIASIDPYFMGSGGGDLRRVSGTALSQVMQQGQMMLSIPMDGMRKYRIEQGEILLAYMKRFMPPESMIRVVGEVDAEPFMQFVTGELDNVFFDIVVGEVPVSPTAQREAWTALTESGALKSLVDHGWLGGQEISLLAADWPEEVRRMVRERAARQDQMMEQQAMMGQQQGGQAPPPQVQ